MAFLAEVRARLGLDTTEFSRGLTKAQADVGAAGADIGKKLNRAFGAGDVFRSLMAGLGIASAQSIADRVARLWTGVSKEIEDGYEKAIAAQEKLGEASIKRMRQMASLETQYQLLLIERARLEKQMQEAPKLEPAGMYENALRTLGQAMSGAPIFGQLGKMAGESADMLARGRGEEASVRSAEANAQAGLRLLEIERETTAVLNEQGKAREKLAAANLELQRIQEENRQRLMSDEEKLTDLREKRANLEASRALSGDEDLYYAREIEKVTGKIVDLEAQLEAARVRAVEQRYEEAQQAMQEERKMQEEYLRRAKEILDVSREYADQEDRIKDAKERQEQAQRSETEQRQDRSALTLEEVASRKFGAVNYAQAREVMRLETEARRQRATGFYSEADRTTQRALQLRSRIPSLSASERYPMARAEDATKSAAEYTSDMVAKLTSIDEHLKPQEIR